MKKRTTLGLFVGLFIFLVQPLTQAENIAFFADEAYTDMTPDCSNEGYVMQQTLIALGHTVTTFTGISDADFTAGLAGQDILVFPEMEDGNLSTDLGPAAITVITNFVNSGGGVIVNGGTGFGSTGTLSNELLNAIFGFSLGQSGFVQFGTSAINVAMAAGTPYEGGPATISNHSGSHFLMATFPAGSKCIYENSPTEATVSLFPYGSGNIIHLAWDWFDGGPGCGTEDADWNAVLASSVTAAATALATVPTMGEWGLIILALLVLSFGTVFMMRRQTAMAGAGNVSMSESSSIPLDKASYGKMLAVVMLGLVAVFAVAVFAFGYEMTNADVPGALIAGPIGAYLLHLLFGAKK